MGTSYEWQKMHEMIDRRRHTGIGIEVCCKRLICDINELVTRKGESTSGSLIMSGPIAKHIYAHWKRSSWTENDETLTLMNETMYYEARIIIIIKQK